MFRTDKMLRRFPQDRPADHRPKRFIAGPLPKGRFQIEQVVPMQAGFHLAPRRQAQPVAQSAKMVGHRGDEADFPQPPRNGEDAGHAGARLFLREGYTCQDPLMYFFRAHKGIGAYTRGPLEIIARGHNQNISLSDASAHAEMMVLREAGKKINNHRLLNAILYVTLEPCLMCVGAMVHARITQVVFGAFDAKTGACGSCVGAHEFAFHNHQLQVMGGVLADECGDVLRAFFKKARN